jgi:hypothetical protein
VDEASASASSLLFASRFGHDPLLDVPHDGRKNAKKSNFNQYGSRSVRLRWRYSVDLPPGSVRRQSRRAPSRRDFSLGYDRLARAGHGKPRPVGEPTPRVGALGRPAVLSSLSYTTTLRSLSALMILLFSGLSPERTMLINDGVTPFFFAHFFWLPARLTSRRSKRTTSF